MVYSEVSVDRSASEAFADWTTEESVESFFAKKAFIDPVPGGDYALWFAVDAPEGSRGSDSSTVLAVEPDKMLSFTWAMPPYMPFKSCLFLSVKTEHVCVCFTRALGQARPGRKGMTILNKHGPLFYLDIKSGQKRNKLLLRRNQVINEGERLFTIPFCFPRQSSNFTALAIIDDSRRQSRKTELAVNFIGAVVKVGQTCNIVLCEKLCDLFFGVIQANGDDLKVIPST